MDSDLSYIFRIRELHQVEDDQIPDDYESGVDDPCLQTRFRCCHALIDLHQPDSLKLVEIFRQKLFDEWSYLPPGGQLVPESVKYDCIIHILNFTESMLSDECNVDRSKFLIAVTFGAIRYIEEIDDEEEDTDGDETMEVNEIRFVPASKSAIEALDNVNSGLGSSECVICLVSNSAEEKEAAKQMPCGHVYHGDCIVRWLEKSHLCPLCRHAMPVD